MKPLIALLCLLPQIVWASSFRLSCFTPTTTLQIWSEGEYLISQIRHPYGAHFTPFFKGQVSVFQVNELALKAQRQRDISDFQEIQWHRDDCQFQAPFKLSCHSGKMVHPVGDDYRAVSLETYTITTQMVNGTFEGLSFNLGLHFKGDYHSMNSDFSIDRHCR